ncbi:hypothetical protein HJG60_009555 [Phyllostomus discolor]|uniref:Uncharacterized protein n=1 Tax=Phyllostomus discolor TaxID=89673 RepID=A0A834DAK0_9CHIR|nr:hypothetical protein HJG60_009555 [Phyllostomus discolor]
MQRLSAGLQTPPPERAEQDPGGFCVSAKVTRGAVLNRSPSSCCAGQLLGTGGPQRLWGFIVWCLSSFFLRLCHAGLGEFPTRRGAWLTPPLSDWVSCSPCAAGGRWSFQPVRPGATARGLVLRQVVGRWSPRACPHHPPGTCPGVGEQRRNKETVGNRSVELRRDLEKWPGAGTHGLWECQEFWAQRRGRTEERREKNSSSPAPGCTAGQASCQNKAKG